MKSYQFFKTYKCFDNKRERTLIQQSLRKLKNEQAGLCFITGCFIISQAHPQFLLFIIRMMQEISNREIGRGK